MPVCKLAPFKILETKTMTNIEHSFEYSAEEAKKGFQANISSLLELHSHLQSKQVKALQNKKEGIFITNEELKMCLEWMLDIAGCQMGHYLNIDSVNRKTNKLFRCALKLQDREQKTPNVRKLLA